MKRDIKPPKRFFKGKQEEVISKGSIIAQIIIGFLIFILTLISWVIIVTVLQSSYSVIPVLLLIAFMIFAFSTAPFFGICRVYVLYYFFYFIFKRIYGRKGQPSRLNPEQRKDVSWETTIDLFEEEAKVSEWVNHFFEQINKGGSNFPNF